LPVVVAEPDPDWFAEVLAHRDLSALWANSRIVPLVGPDPVGVGEFLGTYSCAVVETLLWRPLEEIQSPWSLALADQVAQAQARGRVNLATWRRFGDLWRRNLTRNEASAPPVRALADLSGLWAGVPVVVAAAGPSLAEAFGWIEAFRDRFVLVAVDTAWSSLAARGLSPDVLLVLDGQYWNARHLDRPLPSQTLVVTEWVGPPRAFRLAPDRTYVAATSLPFLRRREESLWGPLGTLASGGSVATAAWSLALHLGAPEVAFAGLDLGFPRGLTHVPGSQFEEALHRRTGRFTPAETLGLQLRGWTGLASRPALDGGQVLSDSRMDLFRTWLSAAARSRPDIRAVNLGTRGSVIPGLDPAGPGYGTQWPVRDESSWTPGPALVPRPFSLGDPPWDALGRLAAGPSGAPAFERDWAEVRRWWGSEVWDRWAGRAASTWARFPSERSSRAVAEVAREALGWRAFFPES
ncbi:MAG TPA: 6-hydroxymethylpterin diphosphokinase MptE-like protein, partial [Spirochaetia bacterium]|nr:6-hydroxymethylpterin diphosphokinase MptE-like protein [Spirochaetia bacterium]